MSYLHNISLKYLNKLYSEIPKNLTLDDYDDEVKFNLVKYAYSRWDLMRNNPNYANFIDLDLNGKIEALRKFCEHNGNYAPVGIFEETKHLGPEQCFYLLLLHPFPNAYDPDADYVYDEAKKNSEPPKETPTPTPKTPPFKFQFKKKPTETPQNSEPQKNSEPPQNPEPPKEPPKTTPTPTPAPKPEDEFTKENGWEDVPDTPTPKPTPKIIPKPLNFKPITFSSLKFIKPPQTAIRPWMNNKPQETTPTPTPTPIHEPNYDEEPHDQIVKMRYLNNKPDTIWEPYIEAPYYDEYPTIEDVQNFSTKYFGHFTPAPKDRPYKGENAIYDLINEITNHDIPNDYPKEKNDIDIVDHYLNSKSWQTEDWRWLWSMTDRHSTYFPYYLHWIITRAIDYFKTTLIRTQPQKVSKPPPTNLTIGKQKLISPMTETQRLNQIGFIGGNAYQQLKEKPPEPPKPLEPPPKPKEPIKVEWFHPAGAIGKYTYYQDKLPYEEEFIKNADEEAFFEKHKDLILKLLNEAIGSPMREQYKATIPGMRTYLNRLEQNGKDHVEPNTIYVYVRNWFKNKENLEVQPWKPIDIATFNKAWVKTPADVQDWVEHVPKNVPIEQTIKYMYDFARALFVGILKNPNIINPLRATNAMQFIPDEIFNRYIKRFLLEYFGGARSLEREDFDPELPKKLFTAGEKIGKAIISGTGKVGSFFTNLHQWWKGNKTEGFTNQHEPGYFTSQDWFKNQGY
jgi:hypothetical protein